MLFGMAGIVFAIVALIMWYLSDEDGNGGCGGCFMSIAFIMGAILLFHWI